MSRQPIRILTYKRTHTGDPDRLGRFGIHDCMGRVRDLKFDTVIGVGGVGAEPVRCGIAHKLTWVGVGARRSSHRLGRGGLVEFDHFILFDSAGPELIAVAPNLARLMYDRNRRFVLESYPEAAYVEALQILDMARQGADQPNADVGPSGRRSGTIKFSVSRKCRQRPPRKPCRRPRV